MNEDGNQWVGSLLEMLGDDPKEKINAMLDSLTGAQSSPPAQGGGNAPSGPAASSDKTASSGGTPELSALVKMQGLLSQLGGTNDQRVSLLLAIKPFLSEERKPHVDRALQLLKLAKLADAAREMDLLKDLK